MFKSGHWFYAKAVAPIRYGKIDMPYTYSPAHIKMISREILSKLMLLGWSPFQADLLGYLTVLPDHAASS